MGSPAGKPMIWNVSNMLSLLRLLLVVPVAIVMWQGQVTIALILFAVAIVTDLLDGYLARKLNQISDAGKIIDPVADKVFVATVALMLVVHDKIPLWFVLAILARDAVILAAGIYAQRKTGIVLPSNYVGKFAVIFTCIAGTLGLLDLIEWRNIAIGISVTLMVASLVLYGLRWVKVLAGNYPGLSKTVS
jgi:cardiolipin synthase